jgi:hypothetical protein
MILLSSLSWAASPAAIIALRGEVEVVGPQGQDIPAALGAELPDGSRVCTGPGSFTTVRLAVSPEGGNHDDVNLMSETCLVVVQTSQDVEDRFSQLTLESGSVSLRDPADRGAGEIRIETASGRTIGSGGFRVHVEEAAQRTEALTRPLTVEGAGQSLELAAGFGSRVHTGEAPGDPHPLPPPGTPTEPASGTELRIPDFSWVPVEEALGYKIEFSATEDFSDLVRIQYVPDRLWQPQRFALPYRIPGLYWRVTSYDRLGFEGVPSQDRSLLFPAGVGP